MRHHPSRSQKKRAARRLRKARALGRSVLSADLQRARDLYPRDSPKVLDLRMARPDLQLLRFSSYGSYPMLYLTKRDEPVCVDCANEPGVGTEVYHHGGIANYGNNGEPIGCSFCTNEIEGVEGPSRRRHR